VGVVVELKGAFVDGVRACPRSRPSISSAKGRSAWCWRWKENEEREGEKGSRSLEGDSIASERASVSAAVNDATVSRRARFLLSSLSPLVVFFMPPLPPAIDPPA